jgi:hypothetical protein
VLALLNSSNLEAAVCHRDALVALAERADEEYFRLSEPESSPKESRQATTLFRRARALSALANALIADPRQAAWEAIYETHAALPAEDLAQFINDMKGHLRRLQAKE